MINQTQPIYVTFAVPERNLPDLDDVPSEVRDQMQFHIVGSVDQVLALALEPIELAIAA